MKIKAYGIKEKGGVLESFHYERNKKKRFCTDHTQNQFAWVSTVIIIMIANNTKEKRIAPTCPSKLIKESSF